jgi:Flp pilus assembly protein TadG
MDQKPKRVFHRFLGRRLGLALRRFANDTRGSLLILTLYLFVIMVFVGGVAVDMMRFEQTRTSLQNTLDRATLAAASLSQSLDPVDVVNDYFAKSGMSSYLESVAKSEGVNFRKVQATGSATIEAYFMHLIKNGDISDDPTAITMTATGISAAEQRVSNVEIALVLDVSESMNSNNRLVNLKAAAKEFVNTVLTNDKTSRVSIAIVPFNSQVNIGPDLRAKYTGLTNDRGFANANCVRLPDAAYNATGLDPTAKMELEGLEDIFSGTRYTSSYVDYADVNNAIGYDPVLNFAGSVCPTIGNNILRLPSKSIKDLQGYIDGLQAIGGTSINVGMKWGVTMLDPSQRSIFTKLRQEGKIPSELIGRPLDFGGDDLLKVVVLMTDGDNVPKPEVRPEFRSGPSPIYRSDDDGYYSIRFTSGRPAAAGANEYYVPHLNVWRATPYGPTTTKVEKKWVWSNTQGWHWENVTVTVDGSATLQDWRDVLAKMRLNYLVMQFYGRSLGFNVYSEMMNNFTSSLASLTNLDDVSVPNTQLQNLCDLAKAQKVIVYGIAFETGKKGQEQISNCASGPPFYFNAQGPEISTAFRAIASNLSQLRLVQ